MNDFQIITKLGEGAYSVVYKAKRLVDDQIYALKKVKLLNLSEKEKSNALNEVRILASVRSDFVICYKEAFFDEKDSTLGIVMEYADRGDLYQKIVEHKKAAVLFEESEIWRIFIQLVKGLKALHELKILHRDLKSANVFLFENGSAKLGDLNVSKVARKGLGYTQTGTPYYASPEVWKDQPYDNKSDIWSLGCVLYEMITLRPPFRAENMEGLYNKVIKGQYNRIPERFSNDLSTILKQLLQVNPDSRPSCEQILKFPMIQKRIEYFKSSSANEEISEDQALLQTIRIPKNLLFLSDKLPKPHYEKHEQENASFHSLTTKKDTSGYPISLKIRKIMNEKENGGSISARNIVPIKNQLRNPPPIQGYCVKNKSNSVEMSPKERVLKQKSLSTLEEKKRNKSNEIKPSLPKVNIGPLKGKEIQKSNLPSIPKFRRISPSQIKNVDLLGHLYQIYAPYYLNSGSSSSKMKRYNSQKKILDNGNNSIAYLNNLEKYYENYKINKKKYQIKSNIDNII